MHELAEVARLREGVQAARTDAALARLAEAIAATGGDGRSPIRPHGRRRLARTVAIAATAVAVSVAVAAIGVRLPRASHPLRTRPGATKASQAPYLGVPASGAQLVAFATKAAERAPLFALPSANDWYYTDTLEFYSENGGTPPDQRAVIQMWQQVGGIHNATLVNGELHYGLGGGRAEQLTGWPGNMATLYGYLAALPASVPALRAVILANNRATPRGEGGQITGAFDAIQDLLNDLAVPPRLQAELYGVLVSLPGVHFDTSAVDAAGRHGVGLYMIESGWLEEEIIINPRTYGYMGNMWVAVRARTEYGTSPAVVHYHKGESLGSNAQLAAGIVQRAGQLPGR
jgi:hypothetical protein